MSGVKLRDSFLSGHPLECRGGLNHGPRHSHPIRLTLSSLSLPSSFIVLLQLLLLFSVAVLLCFLSASYGNSSYYHEGPSTHLRIPAPPAMARALAFRIHCEGPGFRVWGFEVLGC